MATNSQIAFNPQGKTVVVAPLGIQTPVDQRFNAQETGKVRNCARWLLSPVFAMPE